MIFKSRDGNLIFNPKSAKKRRNKGTEKVGDAKKYVHGIIICCQLAVVPTLFKKVGTTKLVFNPKSAKKRRNKGTEKVGDAKKYVHGIIICCQGGRLDIDF